MSNKFLIALLKDYEQKKLKAEIACDLHKKELYIKYPKLQEIDDQMAKAGFWTIKNKLSKDSKNFDLVSYLNTLQVQKNELIATLNIKLEELSPNYECKLCSDTGYISNNGTSPVLCTCIKQKLIELSIDKSNLNKTNTENFSTFNINKFSNENDLNIPVSPRQNILNIKKRAIEFVENFDNPNNRNLLFTGNTGLGKTFMSNCIGAEVIKRGKTVLYQTAPLLLDNVIAYKMERDKSNLFNIYDAILDSDLLIIDDLGTESLNSMKLSELFNIINSRILQPDKKTIISTNLNINQIFKNYEERIGSRIVGYYDLYQFYGSDLRFGNKHTKTK